MMGCIIMVDDLAIGSTPAPGLSNIWLSKQKPNIQDDAKLFERYMFSLCGPSLWK